MNRSTRFISRLLVLTMILGLFAAFPVLNAAAADTNYASGLTATYTKAGAEATPYGGVLSALTDGVFPTAETATDSVWFSGTGTAQEFIFDLGSTKTDLASVYAYVFTNTSNRNFDTKAAKVEVSNDNVTYTNVEGTTSYVAHATNAGYYDFQFNFSAVQSAQYVKVTLASTTFILSLGELEIRNYGLSSGGSASEATDDPTLVDGNYAYGASYTVTKNDGEPTYRNTQQTDGGNWLTDGYEGATPTANGTAYYTVAYSGTGANYVFTLNLGSSKSDISSVTFVNVPLPGDSFKDPTNVAISVSSDNLTYTSVGTLTATSTEKNAGGAYDHTYTFGAKAGQYVQISLTSPGYLFGLDEIVIKGNGGSVEPPVTNEYTVTFVGKDGSTLKTETVAEGGAATAPTAPEVVGYTFKGWDKEFTNVTADITVTAVYEVIDDGSYILDRDFKVDLSAAYGEYDTDNDGTNDFTGIAVDVFVNDITYDRGLLGIEGFLNFDNTKLQPLYVTDADLNGTAIDNPPKTILNWPTFTLLGMNLYAIEGLCQAYSMADGSTTDPANPDATFSKNDSRMRIRYILHTDNYAGYKDGTSIGVTEDGAMALRYYFIVPEGSEGETFTFTVPDTPKATHISECALYAPMSYLDGTTIKYGSVYGFGGEASVTIEESVIEYTVTFVGKDGETLKTETVAEGGAATAPEAPAVEGFEFKGWDVAFDNITADTTVTAIYEEIVIDEPADFFVFADGADTTCVAFDDTNGYLKLSAGQISVANIKALFADSDISFTKTTGAAQTSGNVGTGATITSTINGETKSYVVVILGDVDGNGRLNATDYSKVEAYVSGTDRSLEGAFFAAANVDGNTRLNANDYGAIEAVVSGAQSGF